MSEQIKPITILKPRVPLEPKPRPMRKWRVLPPRQPRVHKPTPAARAFDAKPAPPLLLRGGDLKPTPNLSGIADLAILKHVGEEIPGGYADTYSVVGVPYSALTIKGAGSIGQLQWCRPPAP
jgi:hypothetical protein